MCPSHGKIFQPLLLVLAGIQPITQLINQHISAGSTTLPLITTDYDQMTSELPKMDMQRTENLDQRVATRENLQHTLADFSPLGLSNVEKPFLGIGPSTKSMDLSYPSVPVLGTARSRSSCFPGRGDPTVQQGYDHCLPHGICGQMVITDTCEQ